MRKLFTLTAFILFTTNLYAQKKDDVFYVFKQDWSPAKSLDDAAYFMQVLPEDDTTYVCRYYKKFGPMVKQECYRDAALSIPNGLFFWYNDKGNIDSSGSVVNSRKDGRWNYYGDSSSPQVVMDYNDGARTKMVDYRTKKEYDADGNSKPLEDNKDTAKDTHVYVKAGYPGGPNAWVKYIQRNMTVPDRFRDLTRNGACTVVVSFLVDKEGSPKEVELSKSCEWSADAEAVRIIKSGGNWTPASIDGRKVIYRQRQSLTFSVSGG